MKVQRLTYALFILVLATLGLAFGRSNQTPRDPAKENEYWKQVQARNLRFPTTDYEEPDLADPKKNQARKEKKLRKNDFKVVARNPPFWVAEVVVTQEGGMDFPALPVAESTFIVPGRVTTAEAHISENKKNVYSEFTVLLEKIFKSPNNSIVEGDEITVDRVGGFVRYPKGHTVLYRISKENMPLTGARYVFFLTSKNQDTLILTAYEVDAKGVSPLDESAQFEQYRGLTETAFLSNLREAVDKSSPHSFRNT